MDVHQHHVEIHARRLAVERRQLPQDQKHERCARRGLSPQQSRFVRQRDVHTRGVDAGARRKVSNQPCLAVPADRDLSVGLGVRRRPLMQRERRRERREGRLDLVEHWVGRIRAVPPAKEQQASPATRNVDHVGRGVPNRGVLGKAQDMAGWRHRDGFPDTMPRKCVDRDRGAGPTRRLARLVPYEYWSDSKS